MNRFVSKPGQVKKVTTRFKHISLLMVAEKKCIFGRFLCAFPTIFFYPDPFLGPSSISLTVHNQWWSIVHGQWRHKQVNINYRMISSPKCFMLMFHVVSFFNLWVHCAINIYAIWRKNLNKLKNNNFEHWVYILN